MRSIKIVILICFFSLNLVKAQKLNEVNYFSMDTLKWEKMSDKVYRKYAYGSNVTVAYFKLEKGVITTKHRHPNEQVSHIIEGNGELDIEGVKYIMKKGDILIIPPNREHYFTSLEETIIMDIFSPIRMDWIK